MRLIDSEALMEELKTPVLIDNEKASRIWEGWHECTIAVKEAIDRTPTIEERKTGKWINNIHDIPICDQCGYMTPYDRAIDDYEYGNYCPNCGADMREQP